MAFKCVCQSCRYAFAEDAAAVECPRCHASNVLCRPFKEGEKEAFASTQARKEALTTSKQSWREFHASGAAQKCPRCGGGQFKLDYKHKEKVCLKCGELLPLPRRG